MGGKGGMPMGGPPPGMGGGMMPGMGGGKGGGADVTAALKKVTVMASIMDYSHLFYSFFTIGKEENERWCSIDHGG